MKSIITGGAGFLGCHLAEYLVKLNHKVIIIDNFSTGRLANLKKINVR
jgi:UDP-glucose 4-epimerase